MTDASAYDVIVIGAGIGGLAVAATTQSAGLRTVLLEARAHVGGCLAPVQAGDTVVDSGAESFATRTGAVAAFIAERAPELIVADPRAIGATLLAGTPRRIRRGPLPVGTVLGVPSHPWRRDVRALVGLGGAARASLDRLLPGFVGSRSRTLGHLVGLRMGARVRDVLVDTVCRSVYSSPAAAISVDAVAPHLRADLARTGSLAAAAASASGHRPGSAVRGIVGGLWQLPPAVVTGFLRSGGSVRSNTTVTSVDRRGDGLLHACLGSTTVRAPHLVIATNSAHTAVLLERVEPELADMIAARQRRGVTVAVVRLRSSAMNRRPVGTGVIVASTAGRRAKALTHVNSKWEWLDVALPSGEHIVRLSFDGDSAAVVALASDRQTLAEEISAIVGTPVTPHDLVDVEIVPWSDAVVDLSPQMLVPAAIAQAGSRGLHGAGAWVAGPGLASIIPDAIACAERIVAQTSPSHSLQGVTP